MYGAYLSVLLTPDIFAVALQSLVNALTPKLPVHLQIKVKNMWSLGPQDYRKQLISDTLFLGVNEWESKRMLNLTHVVSSIGQLASFLQSNEVRTNAISSRSILVQIFSASHDSQRLMQITEMIKTALPSAVVVGATTMGEIASGQLLTGSTVLSLSFFSSARVTPIALPCEAGDEPATGKTMGTLIDACGNDIVGVLLLATPHNVHIMKLLRSLSAANRPYPIFGGGAGYYSQMPKEAFVFCNDTFFHQGAVAVVFQGKELELIACTHLGWLPLSQRMTVTEADGMLVKKIDGMPAFSVYQRYLDIKSGNNIFFDAMEFPLLFEEEDDIAAWLPISVDESGAMRFITELQAGEQFRIGYGDPNLVVEQSKQGQQAMADFLPDAIFLYSCVNRYRWMQDDVNLETQPFELIAPTVGFYTSCEFSGYGNDPRLLNSNMVIVGMREDGAAGSKKHPLGLLERKCLKRMNDAYICADRKQMRVISRLVHFIGVVTNELEDANKKLAQLAETDKLTQLSNRLKLDTLLQREMYLAERYDEDLAVVMMDIDKFKEINDAFGHLVGDAALVHVAKILQSNVRKTDIVGRWGGEEFLLICPRTNLEQAVRVAEKLRMALQNTCFSEFGSVTCSFGVTSYQASDTRAALLTRADGAMYKAKEWGRNQVMAE